MINKRISILLLFIFMVSVASAQRSFGRRSYLRNNPMKKYPAIGLGGGGTIFYGDMGSERQGVFQPTGNFKFDYRLSSLLAIEVNATAGMLKEEYASYQYKLANFESTFGQGYLSFRLHFDRIINLNPSAVVSPYASAGIGYMVFESYYNLLDPSGNMYMFNDQGNPIVNGEVVSRDDNYETSVDENLPKSLENSTLIFPVAGGIKFRFTEYFEMNVEGTVFYTNTDFIDGPLSYDVKQDGVLQRSPYNKYNDAYFYGSVTFMYSFGYNPHRRSKRYVPPVRPSF